MWLSPSALGCVAKRNWPLSAVVAVVLLLVTACPWFALADDQAHTDAPQLPPPPAINRTEVTRLAKAAGLIRSSSAPWLQEMEGSTPKWETFLDLGRKIAGVRAEGRRNPKQAKNLVALAIGYLGPPDWVRRRCGTFHENQCDAVLRGAAGVEEQGKARLTSHELTGSMDIVRPSLSFSTAMSSTVRRPFPSLSTWAQGPGRCSRSHHKTTSSIALMQGSFAPPTSTPSTSTVASCDPGGQGAISRTSFLSRSQPQDHLAQLASQFSPRPTPSQLCSSATA